MEGKVLSLIIVADLDWNQANPLLAPVQVVEYGVPIQLITYAKVLYGMLYVLHSIIFCMHS